MFLIEYYKNKENNTIICDYIYNHLPNVLKDKYESLSKYSNYELNKLYYNYLITTNIFITDPVTNMLYSFEEFITLKREIQLRCYLSTEKEIESYKRNLVCNLF